jgi:hypothetical protein
MCGSLRRSEGGDAEGGVQSCRESNFASLNTRRVKKRANFCSKDFIAHFTAF